MTDKKFICLNQSNLNDFKPFDAFIKIMLFLNTVKFKYKNQDLKKLGS